MAIDQSLESRPLRYHLVVLGLWQEPDAQQPVWRFSLEDPHTAERVGFSSLAHLMAGLEAWTTASSFAWSSLRNTPPPAR